jgi:hypothetical protein
MYSLSTLTVFGLGQGGIGRGQAAGATSTRATLGNQQVQLGGKRLSGAAQAVLDVRDLSRALAAS